MNQIFAHHFFYLYDPGFIPHFPGDYLFGMFNILTFNHSPAGMDSVMAAPIKLVQITGIVDFLDDHVTIFGVVWRFYQIPVHKHCPSIYSKVLYMDENSTGIILPEGYFLNLPEIFRKPYYIYLGAVLPDVNAVIELLIFTFILHEVPQFYPVIGDQVGL